LLGTEVTYHLKLLGWTGSWKTFQIVFSAGTREPIHHSACRIYLPDGEKSEAGWSWLREKPITLAQRKF